MTVLLVKKYQFNSYPKGFPEDTDEQEGNTPIDPPLGKSSTIFHVKI